jgi:hypothetical protein
MPKARFANSPVVPVAHSAFVLILSHSPSHVCSLDPRLNSGCSMSAG